MAVFELRSNVYRRMSQRTRVFRLKRSNNQQEENRTLLKILKEARDVNGKVG